MPAALAYTCLALSMLLVGGNIAVGKAILDELPVFLFALLRFAIACLVLAPGMLLPAVRRRLDRQAAGGLFLQAFFGCFLFSLFILHGVRLTSATSAGIVLSITPSLVALLAWLLLSERIAARNSLAIGLAIAGMALLNLLEGSQGGSASLLGNALVLGAVLSEALFAIYSRRLSLSLHPWAMAFGVNLAGLLLFLPLAWPQAMSFDWQAPSSTTWQLLGFYSLSASVLSFLLWYTGISRVAANVAGLFIGLMPLSAALVGVFALGERFAASHALGMVLVLGAIALGAWPGRRPSGSAMASRLQARQDSAPVADTPGR
ncbi:EamA family transporter [Ectopseudomonas mendocina]|nr:EamA family transporter [Pseudomonas mendocina]